MSNRILIVDDETSIRHALAGVLEDEGFTTLAASSAEEALELLDTASVDLVLLDIWLGDGMDGIAALERIRDLRRQDLSFARICEIFQEEEIPTLSGDGQWSKGTLWNLWRNHSRQLGPEDRD